MSTQIEDIKNRLDIVEVIGSYIKLQKAGANYKALCPFHSEKTPSFFISPARQIWHCFGGCGEGGDVFKFVMKIEGVEFGDALRTLSQRAGVELKPLKPELRTELRTERQRLYEICELATKFFERQLEGSSTGKEAKKYLIGRGISEESVKKWRLGYSPESWQGLSDFLTSKGYKNEELEKAGLSVKSEKGSFYDRFRGRIIFPIFDLNSQAVGFSARVFENQKSKIKNQKYEEVAKYVNTPNTLLYDKSRIFYGLDKAKLEIRKRDSCVLVEGNIDLIMAHQAGSQNTVATCGTALTGYQLGILKRYSNNLFYAFDMDIAGEAATERGIDLAQTQGFNIKVVRLSQGKDPADIIYENKEGWEEALKKAESILDFYFELAFGQGDPKTAEGKKKISKSLLPALKRIPNKIEQTHWIQELSKRLESREEDIREELKKVRVETYNSSAQAQKEITPPPQKSRRELLEERLLTLVLKSPQDLNLITENTLDTFSASIKEVLAKLKNNQIPDSPIFNELSLKAEVEEAEKENILPEIKSCLYEIQSLEMRNKLDKISLEIKKAEEGSDLKKIEELTQKFNRLIHEEKKEN
jgi:DNA primase